ncbi:hypothetical protein HDV05_002901, partial [Chytridiales sp. JEL 0842]
NCIGFRFALMEFKTILAILIRNFVFEPCPEFKVRKKLEITWKPHPALKLRVKRVKEGEQ